MKGRNTYGIVILKSLYCLNVYERQKNIWYCNIKEFVLLKCILKVEIHCLNVYERQNYIWYCNIKEFVLFKCI